MAVKFSTEVVIRTIGTYMSVVLYNDVNVMFTDELDIYYILTTKFIIDIEKMRLGQK